MNKINYVIGDATDPQGDDFKVIVHVCNNIGAWGAGFVLAVSKRWKQPEKDYRALKTYTLGDVQMIKVEDDILVANLIGQEGTISRNKKTSLPPVRYVAIEHALKYIADVAMLEPNSFSIHMPRIGSGLAGGNWKIIETVIEETLCKAGVSVTVYDLP